MLRKCASAVLISAVVLAALLAPFAGIERSNRPPNIDSIVFLPSRHPVGEWEPSGLRYKDIYFQASDGTKLHGWLCESGESRGTVLFLHGNAGNIATRTEFLRRLQTELKLDVFAFDYRGYGRSEGRPTIESVFLDSLAAHDLVCRRLTLAGDELILMGESLGGAYAIQLGVVSPPRAIILQSTFSSLRDMAGVHYPQFAGAVSTHTLNSTSWIREYDGPLLQVHGSDDQVVPISLARKLNEAHTGEINIFHEHSQRGHNDLVSEEFFAQIDQFIRELETERSD